MALAEIPNIPISEFHCPMVIPRIINIAMTLPNLILFLIPYNAVSPVTKVKRPYASISTHEKKQLNDSTQSKPIPKLLPATTMDVTLPVPIVYPMAINAGPRPTRNSPILLNTELCLGIGKVYKNWDAQKI